MDMADRFRLLNYATSLYSIGGRIRNIAARLENQVREDWKREIAGIQMPEGEGG